MKFKKTSQAKILEAHGLDFTPVRATEGSVGYDLKACIEDDYIFVRPKEIVRISTGIQVDLSSPESTMFSNTILGGFIYPRSSLGIKGLTLVNTTGVIDADYRGEILLIVTNNSENAIHIARGDRVAQLVIRACFVEEFKEVEELEESNRGEGGFGSTGKK